MKCGSFLVHSFLFAAIFFFTTARSNSHGKERAGNHDVSFQTRNLGNGNKICVDTSDTFQQCCGCCADNDGSNNNKCRKKCSKNFKTECQYKKKRSITRKVKKCLKEDTSCGDCCEGRKNEEKCLCICAAKSPQVCEISDQEGRAEGLSFFSSDMTKPYASVEEARKDAEALARSIANEYISDQKNPFYGPVFVTCFLEDNQVNKAPNSESSFSDVTDYETYQQEAGVVRSDLVKSNGVHVFAGVNERVLVWDLDGNQLDSIKMPEINIPGQTKEDKNRGWRPRPNVQALLMNPEGSKLVVIVGGYGEENRPSDEIGTDTYPIINNYLGTRILVYDVQGTTFTKLSQTDVNGYHSDSYMVGDNVHLVTKVYVNTWTNLKTYLQRWEFNEELTDEEYEAAATLKAEKIIPAFAKKLIDLFTDKDDEVFLNRVVLFVNSTSDSIETKFNDLFGGGIADSITQLHSFNVNGGGDENDNQLIVSNSATVQSGSYGQYVYATNKWMWVTGQGWGWDQEEQTYSEMTIFLGFRLDGASSTFAAVGSAAGSILNQFSVDIDEDEDDGKEYLRIATTQNFFESWWIVRPLPIIEVDPIPIEDDEEEQSRTLNQIIIFEVPPAEGNDDENNQLIEVGSVKVGKINERITAVRFFPKTGYVVTFERTDPFYALDLSDPTEPKILGELEIPGFSEFMHPIKEDNSMLITVGQDADKNGRVLGLQISIFDSTVPNEPKLIDRYIVEDKKEAWSGSPASWEERAFRYLQIGDRGRLIIPVYIYYPWDSSGNKKGNDFDGFMVFAIDLTKSENLITREFAIDHLSKAQDNGCYCGAYRLAKRSMVFDGDLMTMGNDQIISTDLVTSEPQWDITLEDDVECCLGVIKPLN
jgi:hypothetical protein